jgi:hypothetical protein
LEFGWNWERLITVLPAELGSPEHIRVVAVCHHPCRHVQQCVDPFHEGSNVDPGVGSNVQFLHQSDDGKGAFAIPTH